MHPGVDCIACHAASREGPGYTLAGTVMGATHDSDNCRGIANVVVAITDAQGAVQTLTTDGAGNFFVDAAIAAPYGVQITNNGKTAQMVAHQTVGACLSCHTAAGANLAPGRIVAP
jgi:mono/diheme cytochrome c family protein